MTKLDGARLTLDLDAGDDLLRNLPRALRSAAFQVECLRAALAAGVASGVSRRA